MIERNEVALQHRAPNWLVGLAVVALLASLGALGWALTLQNHLALAENRLKAKRWAKA